MHAASTTMHVIWETCAPTPNEALELPQKLCTHKHAEYASAMMAASYQFTDAGASVVVKLDARSSGQVQVQASGDSLKVAGHREAEHVVLLNVPQLYSTVDASAVDWEEKDGQITVRMTKLDPSLQWPQLEVAERGLEQRSEENPLEDREQVKALLSAAQSGDVEAFKAAGGLFPAGQLDAIKDANGRNALHFAAASSNAELCNYLAREEGFPLDTTDESGMHAQSKRSKTACHLACWPDWVL